MAKINQPKEVLVMLAISTGRRPILSERMPKKGALKKEKKEKTDKRRVTMKADKPKDSTYKGRTGMMIPKPITSMATVNIITAFSFNIIISF